MYLYVSTYILNRDVEEILYDDEDKFIGIKSQECYYGKIYITGHSYIKDKVKSICKVIRIIYIMVHQFSKTNDVPSFKLKKKLYFYYLFKFHSLCL